MLALFERLFIGGYRRDGLSIGRVRCRGGVHVCRRVALLCVGWTESGSLAAVCVRGCLADSVAAISGREGGVIVAHKLRVQRTRSKGGGMPAGAVYCGRPGLFGNPFTGPSAKRNVEQFAMWIRGELPEVDPVRRREILERLPTMAGKPLACWCSLSAPCHVDLLCEIANGERET
jgi:hypothetical protein